MIIAFTNTKGGVSKSTLSSHLVLWLFDRGYRVSLLDADAKQKSSSTWIARAEPSINIAVATEPDDIQLRLKELAKTSDVIVADTPGHANDAAHTVAMLCDVAVVPLQPSKLDVRAIRDALQFVFLAQKVSGGVRPEVRIVITNTGKRDVQARRLRQTITTSLSVPVLNAQMRRLGAFLDSPDTSVHRMKGPHAAKAADDVNAIFTELLAGRLPGIGSTHEPKAANE
jgi:chromosome partitioning protein